MKKGKKITIIILIILSSIILCFFSYTYINAYFIQALNVQRPILLNEYPIPAVLYKTGPLKEPPTKIKDLFKKIKQQNPEYTIKYYNDEQCREFIKKQEQKQVGAFGGCGGSERPNILPRRPTAAFTQHIHQFKFSF